MPPLVSLNGEQARQSTFPPGSRVYISAVSQHSISPKNTILAPGEVIGVMLQMGEPGQLDLFYKVEVKGFLDTNEKRTELIIESRLRFLNGSPVTVDLKHGDGKHCVDGIVLGYCDIPPTDDRRKYSGNEEFWYSVQLLDNPNNINNIRIMHEVSSSQLAYRPPATPTLRKSAEKGKTCVKEEMDLDIIPTQATMEVDSSRDTECSTSGGGAEFIATASQSLNEIDNATARVKFEFDAARTIRTGAPHCVVTIMHTDFAQDVTSHLAHEPDNDPTKRKTSRESYQLLNEIHEMDPEVPSKRLKSFSKETKKMPIQKKMGSDELEHSEQVELDPNVGICDLENARRQQFTDREERSQEKVRHIPQTHEEIWNFRLKELHEYKRNFGDCFVPRKFPSNSALGHWVHKQRDHYRCLQDGQRTFLTSERSRILEEVGFVWNVDAYKWNRKLQEVELFFEMKGHTVVPQRSNKSLYQWISRQKSEYKKYLNKGKTQMNGEKVRLLRNAGLQLE